MRMEYQLMKGEVVSLDGFSRRDLAFVVELQQRAREGEDYFSLDRKVRGPGAYPLKGNARITREVQGSPLFRVAEDIVDRTGIEQGVLAADDDDELDLAADVLSATEAAERLEITKSAVIKALRAGRLAGTKIGKTWAVSRRSVESYKVSPKRVAAGRSAHRKQL